MSSAAEATAAVAAAVLVPSPFGNEDDLQRLVARSLRAWGPRREVRLTRGRIDVLTEDGIGVEVKVAGSVSSVRRQIEMYAADVAIVGLVLVTTRFEHGRLRGECLGKPVAVVWVAPL